MMWTNSKPSLRCLVLAVLLVATPIVAVADVGEGKVNFAHDLEALFNTASFNNDYYTGVLAPFGPASGNLVSIAIHGSTDNKAFPADPPWAQATTASAA